MKLLFDQGTPAPLKKFFSTAYQEGWSDLQNGELLAQAEAAAFDVLITTDQNLKYQQKLTERNISIVVLMTTSWPRIKRHVELVRRALILLPVGSYIEIEIP